MTDAITTIPAQKFQDDDSQRPNGPIWMPMYWADYLSHTQHLSPVENSSYLLLIAAYWIRRGPLPDNRKFLCRITRTHPHTWTKIEMNVLAFFERDGGYLKHKRMEKELLKSCDRIASAKRAASARWSSALPTTTTITKEERKKDIAQPKAVERSNGNLIADEKQNLGDKFPEFYTRHPKHKSKAAAERAYRAARKRGHSHEEIMSGLARAIAKDPRFRDPSFTPYPASWLNADGFLDEHENRQQPRIPM